MLGTWECRRRCFDNLIPESHPLRVLDKIICQIPIRAIVEDRYAKNRGRPSVAPELYVRMVVISYFYNINSDRKLCQEITYNMAYRWFCHLSFTCSVPSHSTLSRLKSRLGLQLVEKIFYNFIKFCKGIGFCNGDRLIVDGTLIEANASKKSFKAIPNNKNSKTKRNTPVNKYKRSVTDPDSAMIGRGNISAKLRYKVHFSIDANSRIILDCYTTSGSVHESSVMPSRILAVQKHTGYRVHEVLADRGYGTGKVYNALNSMGIEIYIPLFNESIAEIDELIQGFTFDRKQNCFFCPTGHKLHTTNYLYTGNVKKYRSTVKNCFNCDRKQICLNYKVVKLEPKRIFRNIYHDLFVKVKQRSKNIDFKLKQNERHWKIEGINSEAKLLHCLRRARYRTLKNVQIQTYWSAIVMNFKRLINFVNKGPIFSN